MSTSPSLGLADHFAALDDPCVERTKLHPLLSIVVIASCAVISGAAQASRVRRTSGDDIEDFGEIRAAWFVRFLDLPHGSRRMTPLIGCLPRSIPRSSSPVSWPGYRR